MDPMFSDIHDITINNKSTVFGLILTGLLIISSGCGKNGNTPIATLINDVSLKTYLQDHDQWMNVSVKLTTGGFSMTGIHLPIVNPNDSSKVYGEFTLVPTLCNTSPCNGGGQLTVALNLTETSQTQGVSIDLPNGTALPVGGLQNANVIALPVAQTGAKIYLAFAPGMAMFGAAVPFSALDPAGKYLPGVDVFEPLTFDKINLIAGIFAGAATNTTGVGIFLDLSSVLNDPTANVSPKALASSEQALASSEDVAPGAGSTPAWQSHAPQTMTFGAVKPASSTERKLYQKLFRLSQQGLTLHVQ